MAPQKDNRLKVSALLRAGHRVGSQTLSISHNRLRIKKRIDDGEGVNRRDGSVRKTVVERGSLRDAMRGTSSNGIPQEWHPQTVFRSLPARLLIPSSSFMRRLCETPRKSLRPHSVSVPHEEV